jgi:hypothetical protein
MFVSNLFTLFLLSLPSTLVLLVRCGSSSKLQSDCCIPLAGHHSVRFLFNSSPKTLKILTDFDAKIVLIGSEICYTFFSQQLVPQLGSVLLFVYPTTLSSLSLSRASEPCDLLMDFAHFFFFSDIDVFKPSFFCSRNFVPWNRFWKLRNCL